MKPKIIAILLCLTGMTVFAEGPDMSYYMQEFSNLRATFLERLEILETVRDANYTEIGEFYHDALKVLIHRIPDINTSWDRGNVEASARILVQGLAAEIYTEAAPEIWQIVQFADTVRIENDGILMQEALIALGQVGDLTYVRHITLRLDNYNAEVISDLETRSRVQRGVVGCINALEALGDPAGYRHVFLVTVGWYDMAIRNIARSALPNILEDPADIIIEIIQAPSIAPSVKLEALQEMLASQAPDSSKARVAAAALDTGWTYITSDINNQRILREMRALAIDTIRDLGVYTPDSDPAPVAVVATGDDDEEENETRIEINSVYVNLRRSYMNNFVNVSPDFDEIRRTILALSALGTDEAVDMLLVFLRELHIRRRLGPWDTTRERQVFNWIVTGLGETETQSPDARNLLNSIQRSGDYTGAEQTWARNALARLSQ